ncbi:MAG: efflux transporter outer membrane subunit [Syntrophobacteraceae bacterium]|jgi:NodT family efflux transporter outer membrane factor (OMF) lipoprotein|nr:efflux transporter outer membrane subunit [Syntrophobacteraceae bacterium]
MPTLIITTVWAWMGIAGFLASGCTVGPDYVRPRIETPPRWSELPAAGAAEGPAQVADWWSLMGDEKLESLIHRAVESNMELRLAEARAREARAARGVVSADAYPAVDAAGSFSRSRSSGGVSTGGDGVTGSGAGGGRSRQTQDFFQVGFDASWEVDIFGGVRRSVEAADADIQASEENLRDVMVSLVAEVARSYIQLRGDQRRIAIAEDNLKSQERTLELTQGRFEAGLSSELDVAQARAQLATTEARVPVLEASARQAIHQLGVLLGMEPGALLGELEEGRPIPVGPGDIPVGLPSDLLRRRPDVRRAERELAAATARVGVATADLFPRFFLTGAAGLDGVGLVDVAMPTSTFWKIGPSLRWPVFDAGRARAVIQVQDARQEHALVSYERSVLGALKDVEDALVAYSKEHATRAALLQAVDASRRAVEISRELYTKGLVDFLNVLINQRALDATQDQLAVSEQALSTNLVALYKALGGGWE